MSTQTATTELEAINIMLGTIGESPINSLEVSGLADAATAMNILNEVSRAAQTKRLSFNTETEYPIAPDTNGNILLPPNTLHADTSVSNADVDVVQRGNKLYDKYNHTFIFTKTLKLDITFFLPFEQMPEAARHYVNIRAARIFQARILGSETVHKFTVQDENSAWAELAQTEADAADYNILSGSYGVARVLDRRPDSGSILLGQTITTF
jgi:hypothetical protein